ncbi:MAG: type II toxin-antitoxin system prevent-host-death family antitoxin [Planctomycetota bacterium]
MVKIVDLFEPNATLSELVSLATSGTQVVVTQAGNPVARLISVAAVMEPRVPDLHLGAFEPSEDFDKPLPDEFWAGEP